MAWALAPELGIHEPVEEVLPHSIVSNDFVKEMVHPGFAEIQDFLGYPTPRPSAPFIYTNDWGGTSRSSCRSSSSRGQPGKTRFKLFLASRASIVPVLLSLNRGLWLSLGVGLFYAAVRLSIRGRERALIAFVVGCRSSLSGALFFSPLGSPSRRIATPHSNNRRVSLYEEAVWGAAESPCSVSARRAIEMEPERSLGRDARPDLARAVLQRVSGDVVVRCMVPRDIVVVQKSSDPLGFWVHVMLVIMFLQLAVYGLLPVQIHIVMLGIALAWRERFPVRPSCRRLHPMSRTSDIRPCTKGWPETASISSGDVVLDASPRSPGCEISCGPIRRFRRASSGLRATPDPKRSQVRASFGLQPHPPGPDVETNGRDSFSIQRRDVIVRTDPEACGGA